VTRAPSPEAVIDEVETGGHGIIVRTAAEGVSADELQRDIETLLEQWNVIEAAAQEVRYPWASLPGARAVGTDSARRSSTRSIES